MRWLLMALVLVVVLAVGFLSGLLLTRMVGLGPGRPAVPTVAVLQEIQTLSELATVRYVIQKVVEEEDVKWFGENRVLLVAYGTVKAGVDFDRLQPGDVEINGSRVRIDLPPPQILDAYLDESKTQVIERSTGLLRRFDKDLETVARQHAVMDIRRAARVEGILTEADDRAREQIRSVLQRMGFEEVDFVDP